METVESVSYKWWEDVPVNLKRRPLMDENQTLYRLKELEFLGKICEKIGMISLSGSSNLLGAAGFFVEISDNLFDNFE